MKGDRKGNKEGKKIRKLYHLDREDALFVREYAKEKGISESAVIRLSVRNMQKDLGADPLQRLIGSVDGGLEGAVRHDEVIYE